MINLLPPEEKTKIIARKKLTLVLIFEAAISLFLISLLLISFSIRIYLAGEIETQKITVLGEEKGVSSSTISEFQQKIKDLNEDLEKTAVFYETRISVPGTLARVSELLPPGSYLTNISFLQGVSGVEMTISGFAQDREGLLTFKKGLESEKSLTKVNFPQSNWVSPTNIDFSFTAEIR
jgi:Tfp pilus assembly protein PilN